MTDGRQSIDQIESHYHVEDPWGFKTNPDDQVRKDRIIEALQKIERLFGRALDIGCGEGWITKDLPASELWGWEASESARSRWPVTIHRFEPDHPSPRHFDLITAMGVFYPWYDTESFLSVVRRMASGIFLASSMPAAEIPILGDRSKMGVAGFVEIDRIEFPYRDTGQIVRIFQRIPK